MSGLQGQIQRYFIAITHELILVLQKSKKHFDNPKFIEIESTLDDEARRSWQTIKRVALNEIDDKLSYKDLRKFLKDVRDKTAFHLKDFESMKQGYRGHFTSDLNAPEQRRYAFVSDGRTMEQTRFYFADAACAHFVASHGSYASFRTVNGGIGELISNINSAIKPIVCAFLTWKDTKALLKQDEV